MPYLSISYYGSGSISGSTGKKSLRKLLKTSISLSYLDGLSLKAVLVRPGLIDWNPISRTHTLEQMLEEIGEPVYRWKRKEVVE